MLKKKNDDKPSTFSIANGFAIGQIPHTLKFKDKTGNGEVKTGCIDAQHDPDDLICADISPVRPFGYVHAYTA
jgi:hypothetical protein